MCLLNISFTFYFAIVKASKASKKIIKLAALRASQEEETTKMCEKAQALAVSAMEHKNKLLILQSEAEDEWRDAELVS